jgi:arylformamidase
MARGERLNLSEIRMSVHAGTHVDAPLHFLADGESVERIPLEILVGRAWVAAIPTSEGIGRDDLAQARIPESAERVLLRTNNSLLWAEGATTFHERFAHLTEDGAEWLVGRGARLVGVDYLSVQGFHDGDSDTHRILLGAGIVIVESLNLVEVEEGWYDLYCLPLKVVGADGAPARAVLIG